jgi:hypothetical protein
VSPAYVAQKQQVMFRVLCRSDKQRTQFTLNFTYNSIMLGESYYVNAVTLSKPVDLLFIYVKLSDLNILDCL